MTTLTGTAGSDTLTGGLGDDTITGLAGNDTIDGQSGSDSIDGSEGDDSIVGGFGNDTLLGGAGNDTLSDDQGDNLLDGGAGNDQLTAQSLTGSATLIGGSDNDTLLATGVLVNLDGGSGDDSLSVVGYLGDYVWVKNGAAHLAGGTGNDRLTSNVYDIVTMDGGDGNDNLNARNSQSVSLIGGAGGDVLNAGLCAVAELAGGNGDDTLTASGSSAVVLSGGIGNDFLSADMRGYDGLYNGKTPYAQKTALLAGDDGSDTLVVTGYGSANSVRTMITLLGGAGNDHLTVTDSQAGKATYASHEYGFAQASLDGGEGDDVLMAGGVLQLSLTGGTGADAFMLTAQQYRTLLEGSRTFQVDGSQSITMTADPTVITDFEVGAGKDMLDYSDLMRNAALSYDGSNPFTAGYLKLTQAGADTLLSFDADGLAGVAKSAVTITVLKNVIATDLVAGNFNAVPTGEVTIAGSADQGLTLTATNNLNDTDGLGAISYQWKADGVNINGANGNNLVLAEAQVGKAISVVASYVDGHVTTESISSGLTDLVEKWVLALEDTTLSGKLSEVFSSGIATYGDIGSSVNGGTVAVNSDGSYTYKPSPNFTGVDWFQYLISDGSGTTILRSASVMVSPVNDAPSLALATAGKALVAVGDGDFRSELAAQTDGKLVIAGGTRSFEQFAVIRLGSDGILDSSFGSHGAVTIDLSPDSDWRSSIGVATRPDGVIVLAGGTLVVSLTSMGLLDSSFGISGRTSYGMGSAYFSTSAIALQADGKTVLVGGKDDELDYFTWATDFAVVRLNHDGSLDRNFASDGLAAVSISPVYSEIGRAVAIQSDGKIIVAGDSQNNFCLIRLNSNGGLDNSFSDDGKLIIATPYQTEWAAGLAIQTDGSILIAGTGGSGSSGIFSVFEVVRLSVNGTLDASFGNGGTVVIPLVVSNCSLYSVIERPDGKIVLIGFVVDSMTGSCFEVIQLNANGTVDSTFGIGGEVRIAGGEGRDATLMPDGKIVVAGNVSISAVCSVFGAIRLNIDGSLDTSFNPTATYTENGAAVALNHAAGVVDVDLSALAGGLGNYNGSSLTLSRAGGASAQDLFSAKGNLVLDASSGTVLLDGIVTGSFTQSAGKLTINFNDNATQAAVNNVVSSLAYANSSDAPPASLQIELSFNDGNTGGQGAGDALTSTGQITVNITAVNDSPTGSVTISGTATQGQTLTAANTLADADGLGTISYQWQADGAPINAATGNTFVISAAQGGKAISVVASYTDGHGTAESVNSSSLQVPVGANVDMLTYSWNAHTLLSGISLSTDGHSGSTGAGGAAGFTAVVGTSMALTAGRAVPAAETAATDQAVNLQDAIAILKMIVGLDVNGAGKALSPYQAYAADYDGSGKIELSDAIGVLKHVVGLDAPTPQWLFFNEIDLTVPGKANLLPGSVPGLSADLSGSGAIHVGLVGVLRGDVDGSYAGAAGALDLDTDATHANYFTLLLAAHNELSPSQFGVYPYP